MRLLLRASLVIAIVVLAAGLARAGDATGPSVAMLPLANYTDQPDLVEFFTPLLIEQLHAHTSRLVPAEELRPILRHHRIRAVGSIDGIGAQEIQREADVDYLLLGSVDLYQEGQVPEAAISLRLLHAATMRIVWAVSVAATGEDYVTVLNLGRVTDRGELARRLVARALATFDHAVSAFDPNSQTASRMTTALIPFDDLDLKSRSGSVFTTHILTALVNRGADVLEPGEVAAMLQRHRRVFRGEIDFKRLHVLHDSLGVDAVITGYVQQFKFGVASVAAATPHLEIGARLIDGDTGQILSVLEWERDGADTESFFGTGTTHAMGKLTQAAASDLLKKFGYDHDTSRFGKK